MEDEIIRAATAMGTRRPRQTEAFWGEMVATWKAPDIKLAARQTEALPVLAQFLQWLEANSIGLLPRAPLAKAFGYALRH